MGINEDPKPVEYTICLSSEAQRQIDNCCLAFARGEEVWESLEKLLHRKPTAAQRITNTIPPQFIAKSQLPIGPETPVITVSYRLEADMNTVLVLKIRYHDC